MVRRRVYLRVLTGEYDSDTGAVSGGGEGIARKEGAWRGGECGLGDGGGVGSVAGMWPTMGSKISSTSSSVEDFTRLLCLLFALRLIPEMGSGSGTRIPYVSFLVVCLDGNGGSHGFRARGVLVSRCEREADVSHRGVFRALMPLGVPACELDSCRPPPSPSVPCDVEVEVEVLPPAPSNPGAASRSVFRGRGGYMRGYCTAAIGAATSNEHAMKMASMSLWEVNSDSKE